MERQRIGRVCKWIIDTGRVKYMQVMGFSIDAIRLYCDPGDSLEDGLLLGVAAELLRA